MAEIILYIVLYGTLAGFVSFCVLYAVLAQPWRDHMGRHVLFFMTGFMLAFIYAAASGYLTPDERINGWILVLAMICGLVWWRVAILLKYQIQARRDRTSK